MKTRHIPEEGWELAFGDEGDAAEILTGSYGEFTTPDGALIEVEDHTQRDELLEEWEDHEGNALAAEEEAEAAHDQLVEKVEELQKQRDSVPTWQLSWEVLNRALEATKESLQCAQQELAQARKLYGAWASVINELRRADWEPSEIMLTNLRRYYEDDIDLDIAKRCGLIVVRRTDDDSTWITNPGCGYCPRAKYLAYQALHYQAIDEQYVRKLGEHNWEFEIPRDVAEEVKTILGLQTHLKGFDSRADAQARIEAVDQKIQSHDACNYALNPSLQSLIPKD